jgi:hypothetical protein
MTLHTKLSLLPHLYLNSECNNFIGMTWTNALFHVNCSSLIHFRWGGGTEVWFLNASAFLFCCWLTQTKIKCGFHNWGEPFAVWLSPWLFDRKHMVFTFPSPGQSHYGFFWNVRQSDCYSSSLISATSFYLSVIALWKLDISLDYYRTSGYYVLCNSDKHEISRGCALSLKLLKTKNSDI